MKKKFGKTSCLFCLQKPNFVYSGNVCITNCIGKMMGHDDALFEGFEICKQAR